MEQRLVDVNKITCENTWKEWSDDHGDYIACTAPTVLTIPENPTNGDVIKALFPNIEIYDSEKMESVYTGIPFGKYVGANVVCMRDWWNAPYKSEGNK